MISRRRLLILFAIPPLTLAFVFFVRFQLHGHMQQTFPLSDAPKQQLESGQISITEPLDTQNFALVGSFLGVSTTETSVAFEPKGFAKLFYPGFEIPRSAVHSCSQQCGGSERYILILEEANREISIADAPALMDWCWDNQIPMLSSTARRQWLYDGTSLPAADELTDAMVSREAYDAEAQRACQGC